MSHDPASDRTTSASPRTFPKNRKRRLAGLVALLVVAGAGLFYFGAEWYKGWQGKRVVTSYLEAVQNGDVEEALSYQRSFGDTVRTDFVTSDALNTAWEVLDVSVEQRDTSIFDRDYVWVHVIIGSEDGTEVSETFRAVNDETFGWRVEGAVTYLAFDSRNYGYLEVNGHTAEETDGARTVPRVFAFLPGIYDFYADGNSLLEFDGGPVVMLGSESQAADGESLRQGRSRHDSDISDRLTFSDDAEDRYQHAIRDHVDDCVDALTGDDHGGTQFSCELGATEDQLQSEVGGSYSDFRDYQWDLVSYPTAELEYVPYPQGEMIWLRGEAKQPGAATLTVEASDTDGNNTRLTFACDVNIEHSRAVVDHTGELYFQPKRFNESSSFRNVYESTWDDFFASTAPCSLA